MIRGGNSDSIPIDLIIEIISRLPAKSIARCRCVSKLWTSILDRPYFTELFLTRSSARPRLLFALERAGDWCLLTSPQAHNPYEKSSLVVAADFHMKLSKDMSLEFCGLASGLLYFRRHMLRVSKEDKDTAPEHVICKPSTGQYVTLPNVSMSCGSRNYLGFDPIDKQFKVLSMRVPFSVEHEPPQILTLETGKGSWRKIHCPLTHLPLPDGVCINGVLYYLAIQMGVRIVCFDVRSEKFRFMERESYPREPRPTKLINYKGKLCGITWQPNGPVGIKHTGLNRELHMWVIEDVEKPEWSHYSNIFWEGNKVVDCDVVGATATGEIVLSMDNPSKPFYVFYYNPERKTLKSVEIRGFGANHEAFKNCHGRVEVFVNHVEDLNFIK